MGYAAHLSPLSKVSPHHCSQPAGQFSQGRMVDPWTSRLRSGGRLCKGRLLQESNDCDLADGDAGWCGGLRDSEAGRQDPGLQHDAGVDERGRHQGDPKRVHAWQSAGDTARGRNWPGGKCWWGTRRLLASGFGKLGQGLLTAALRTQLLGGPSTGEDLETPAREAGFGWQASPSEGCAPNSIRCAEASPEPRCASTQFLFPTLARREGTISSSQ